MHFKYLRKTNGSHCVYNRMGLTANDVKHLQNIPPVVITEGLNEPMSR